MRAASAGMLALLLIAQSARAQESPEMERSFQAFWNAGSVKAAEKAADAVVAAGASFSMVFERLTDGRPYKPGVDTGELHWTTLPGGGPTQATTVVVPRKYNPLVKYPVRVFLHGGVARPDAPEPEDSGGLVPNTPKRPRRRLEFKERYIAVYPSGYADAQWWFSNQIVNLNEILDRLKRSYNIDENRVHLMGVSDGGTGAFFVGAKDATAWSTFFPLNGFLRVLANPLTRADGDIFITNLKNRPIYAVNGGRDPLYPATEVVPFLVALEQAGTPIVFRPMMEAGHDTSWWPTEVNAIDTFEEDHPRDPHQSSLSWETERTDRYNRLAWLMIDRLDPSTTETKFPDYNWVERREPADFGLRVDSRRDDGRKIIEIITGTTAAAMGMKKGDTIIRMDDSMIHSPGDMGRAFDEHAAGTPLVFEVERKGQRITMEGVFPPPPKPSRREEIFKHAKPSGRVDVTRRGNSFQVGTRGVGAFTLLLSPSVVDFDKPVTVFVNGKTVFDGKVERSVSTLLRWAARDNDRSMLFGAELQVTVP